jgi:hypothetical protein
MLFLLIIGYNVKAKENIDLNLNNYNVKYYKITTITDSSKSISYTQEITENEYEAVDVKEKPITRGNATIENSYAKLTTSISSISTYYRYNADVEWKNISSTRSYDTIGIGFPSNVKKLGGLYFSQTYCTSSSNCSTSTSYSYSYSGSNGVGVTFQLPTGSLYSLTHHMHFNVTKNTTSTITAQHAYGSFAHATSSVSLTNAKKYTVDLNGIVFQSGVGSYYDIIGVAHATWNGTW